MTKETCAKVPESAIAHSDELKAAKKPLTTAQIPAFKKAKELHRSILVLTGHLPRKMAKFSDQILSDCSELMKSVALANEHCGEERIFYASNGLGVSHTLAAELSNLRSASKSPDRNGNLTVYIGQDEYNKLKAICDSVNAQLAGWRDFTRREGHNYNR